MATATASKGSVRKATPVVSPIRNGREFEQAVTELDFWTDSDPKQGSPQYDRMELLTILIAAYEEEHLPPIEPASPQELVRFMAEQKGMSNSDLAKLLGGRPRLSEFVRGTRELSKAQIVRLGKSLGIPADLLLSR